MAAAFQLCYSCPSAIWRITLPTSNLPGGSFVEEAAKCDAEGTGLGIKKLGSHPDMPHLSPSLALALHFREMGAQPNAPTRSFEYRDPQTAVCVSLLGLVQHRLLGPTRQFLIQ